MVLALIFGNLVYAVHFSKSQGQITVKDKRKVSEALKSFEPRRDSLTASKRFSNGGQSAELSSKIKTTDLKMRIESDLESGGSAINGGTQSTSGSLREQILVSDISLSGFDTSSHQEDKLLPLVPAITPLRKDSKAVCAGRWVPSPSPSQKSEQMNSKGPALPKRFESVIDQSEYTNSGIPSKLPMSKSSDEDDDSFQEAEQENSQQHPRPTKKELEDTAPDAPERLTSIAELEWSDDQDNLTNQTPAALLESASPEQAPVMPVRCKSEIQD